MSVRLSIIAASIGFTLFRGIDDSVDMTLLVAIEALGIDCELAGVYLPNYETQSIT